MRVTWNLKTPKFVVSGRWEGRGISWLSLRGEEVVLSKCCALVLQIVDSCSLDNIRMSSGQIPGTGRRVDIYLKHVYIQLLQRVLYSSPKSISIREAPRLRANTPMQSYLIQTFVPIHPTVHRRNARCSTARFVANMYR
jgi:hypothetical protein